MLGRLRVFVQFSRELQKGVTKMDFVPPFVLLDVELLPSSVKPEIRS